MRKKARIANTQFKVQAENILMSKTCCLPRVVNTVAGPKAAEPHYGTHSNDNDINSSKGTSEKDPPRS